MPQSGTYGSVGALGGNPRATRQPAMPRTEPQERRVAESPDHADHGKSSRLINLMIRHASVLKTLCVTSYGSQKVARSSKREPQRRPSGRRIRSAVIHPAGYLIPQIRDTQFADRLQGERHCMIRQVLFNS